MAASTPSLEPKSSSARKRMAFRRRYSGVLYVLPSVLFVLIFFIIPLCMTLLMSLYDWPLMGTPSYSGFDNYVALTKDNQFWDSLWFTTRYTLIVTPPIFILAFILAHLVKLPLRWIGLFRTIYFLPVVIGLGASSLIWVWLLNDRVGIFNRILIDLGLIDKAVLWLGDKNLALAVIIISVVWKTVGFTMILLLAGLQSIPNAYYEASEVDGATAWSKMLYITLPLLRRTIALALVLSVIGSYLAFDQFYIITRGGPRNSTITVVYWIFNNSFTYFKMGYGAALSVILMGILVVLSVIQLYLLRDDTEY
jgi:multiple sugar transport system permease protein